MSIKRTCDGCGSAVEGGSIRYVLTEFEHSVPAYRQDYCSYPCVLRQKVTGGRSRHAPVCIQADACDCGYPGAAPAGHGVDCPTRKIKGGA